MKLRLPQTSDFEFYYDLKCESSSIYWGGFEKPPDKEGLRIHFLRLMQGEIPKRKLYLLEDQGRPVGYLQLTRNSETEIEFGYGVSERFRGCGYGSAIVGEAKRLVSEMENTVDLIAYVREDNYASRKCCEKNGMLQTDKYDIRHFALDRADVKMDQYRWNKQMDL